MPEKRVALSSLLWFPLSLPCFRKHLCFTCSWFSHCLIVHLKALCHNGEFDYSLNKGLSASYSSQALTSRLSMRFWSGKQTVGNSNRSTIWIRTNERESLLQLSIRLRVPTNLTVTIKELFKTSNYSFSTTPEGLFSQLSFSEMATFKLWAIFLCY